MQNNKNEEIIAYIKFNHEIKKVILAPTLKEFQKKICNILNIDETLLNSLKLSYKDEDGDTISVSSEEDYNILLNQVKSKEVDILNIETDENADIDIDACSNSVIKFHEKIEKEEIEEEDKNNKNNLNIISNQQFEINHEEKRNIQKNNNNEFQINKNNVNDNFEINKNQNNIIIDRNNHNNNIYSNNNNNFNNFNNINNINNFNNINNINNQNNIRNINNNNINLNEQTYMVFPYNCNLCNEYPIVKVLYYCLVCGIPLCQKCEEKLGINHRHSILKVQTKEQYDDLNLKINGVSKEIKNNENNENNPNQSIIKNITTNLNTLKDSFIGAIFGEEKNDENRNNINRGLNNNNNQQMAPQKMSLIQLARAQYDLNGISDNQLQEAIEKTNGNIDDAIVLLMS